MMNGRRGGTKSEECVIALALRTILLHGLPQFSQTLACRNNYRDEVQKSVAAATLLGGVSVSVSVGKSDPDLTALDGDSQIDLCLADLQAAHAIALTVRGPHLRE